jgi:hypothetical protein
MIPSSFNPSTLENKIKNILASVAKVYPLNPELV